MMTNKEVLEGYKPKDGARIGFKKANLCEVVTGRFLGKVIVVLEIPKDARVNTGYRSFHCWTKKRASSAFVLGVVNKDSGELLTLPDGARVVSAHNHAFVYEVGETVHPTQPFDRSREECASGIHFFDTFDEAARYHL